MNVRLERGTCRERMTWARVAHLATSGIDGRPHLVPITFALDGERLVTGIDQKPKSTTDLRRLRNVVDNPKVAVLCDHYDDDWSQLWWVRVDGLAEIVTDGSMHDTALAALTTKYPQYRTDPPRGPVIVIEVRSWSGWSFG